MNEFHSYTCRNSELRADVTYVLEPEGISWSAQGRPKERCAYTDFGLVKMLKDSSYSGPRGLANVTLTTQASGDNVISTTKAPESALSSNTVCDFYLTELKSSNQHILISCGQNEHQDDYKAFIVELNQRVKTARPDAQFTQGSWFGFVVRLICIALWLVLCGVILLRFTENGDIAQTAVTVVGIFGLVLGFMQLRRYEPGAYNPIEIPQSLLPN